MAISEQGIDKQTFKGQVNDAKAYLKDRSGVLMYSVLAESPRGLDGRATAFEFGKRGLERIYSKVGRKWFEVFPMKLKTDERMRVAELFGYDAANKTELPPISEKFGPFDRERKYSITTNQKGGVS